MANTGKKAYRTLEQYNTVTFMATGTTKPNVDTDPDYFPPVDDLDTCPVPVSPNEPAPEPEPVLETRVVHLSGALMSDQVYPPQENNDPFRFTKIYVEDDLSEFVELGDYPDSEVAFPKAHANTFDGIAIESGVILRIWNEKNYTGDTVLWIAGPALIYNVRWNKSPNIIPEYQAEKERTFSEPLQTKYPQSKRYWSATDMNTWGTGSCKIYEVSG